MPPADKLDESKTKLALVAYYTTVFLFLLTSFFPEQRVWGINQWAYLPTWSVIVLFIMAVFMPAFLLLGLKSNRTRLSNVAEVRSSNIVYAVASLTIICFFCISFYAFMEKTHFIGDGYQVLSQLASERPFLKPLEFGETLIHKWVKQSLSGSGEEAALKSFQILSFSSGLLFLITVGIAARLLYSDNQKRLLFMLGVVSGGYMLLFFGHVENYSIFVAFVGLYTFCGLLVSRGILGKWWIVLLLSATIFLHLLGLALIPSAVFLLTVNTRCASLLSRQSIRARTLLIIGGALVAILIYAYCYSTSMFFRFSILPIFKDRFTVERYTLFSLKHILDYINLLLVLIPGILVLATSLTWVQIKNILRQKPYRYLLILILSTSGVAFLLDPRLGMPRDWDLLSFIGVPLSVLAFYTIIDNCKYKSFRFIICSMSIAIACLSLLPRVVAQSEPSMAIAHLKNTMSLDLAKSRTARYVLVDYYEKAGKQAEAESEKRKWSKELPYNTVLKNAISLIDRNEVRQAMPMLWRVIEADPRLSDAWMKLGRGYYALNQLDSALICLRISAGMNPFSSGLYSNMGLIYFKRGENENAEREWKKALRMDAVRLVPLIGLATLYEKTGADSDFYDVLVQIAERDDSPVEYISKLADYYLARRDYTLAAHHYRRALAKGLDRSYVDSILKAHPNLKIN